MDQDTQITTDMQIPTDMQFSPSQQAYTQAAGMVAAAAQTIHPFDNTISLLLAHQAKALLQMVFEPRFESEDTCESPVSAEVSADVDALVRDIEEMMKSE